MKRFVLFIYLLSAISVFSQEESDEFNTIFGSDFESGGYGAPELKLGNVNEEIGLLLGGRGGWVIGHKFVLGLGGYGLTSSNKFNYTEPVENINNILVDSTRTLNIGMGYGGLLFEFIAMPKKAIHLTFPVIIGAGGASIMSEKYDPYSSLQPEDYSNYKVEESSGFFVLEPGVNVELNMVKFLRLGLGASYRWVAGSNLERLDNNDLSDFTFNLTLKFGKF